MARPLFYLVHDDGEILGRLAADLERRFGADYDIVGEVTARTVVVATGLAWRRLDVPALEPLHGAGAFYGAAASEAAAVEGPHVFVVSAGNSAGQAAVHLARHAAGVTLLIRGERLGATMSDYLVRELESSVPGIFAAGDVRARSVKRVASAVGSARSRSGSSTSGSPSSTLPASGAEAVRRR